MRAESEGSYPTQRVSLTPAEVPEIMKPGDKVEVNQIWASQGALKPVLKSWFAGYEIVEVLDKQVKVKNDRGVILRYSKEDVRPEEAKTR